MPHGDTQHRRRDDQVNPLGFALKLDEATEERLAYDEMRKKLMDSLKRVFRPEFINRLDSVIVFRALSREDIQEIVRLELDKVADRLKDHDISLTATPARWAGRLGYDPDGARPGGHPAEGGGCASMPAFRHLRMVFHPVDS
jgi:ATP-dependent Clp protease ATP-binding subunit ClpA